jgi:predicted RNA binding protein YcfA (HicA-like mRNA interferase family)
MGKPRLAFSASRSRRRERLARHQGRRVLAALYRIGWTLKRETGSHRTLTREGWTDFVFSFHDDLSGTSADPIAALTGTWNPNQQAEGTVKVDTAEAACCHEVEVHLRMTTVDSVYQGYEILCSVVPSYPYIGIVKCGTPTVRTMTWPRALGPRALTATYSKRPSSAARLPPT